MEKTRTNHQPMPVEESAASSATALDLLARPATVRVLHPARDVVDGTLWYGVPAEGALVEITSKREAHRADQLRPASRCGTPIPARRWSAARPR